MVTCRLTPRFSLRRTRHRWQNSHRQPELPPSFGTCEAGHVPAVPRRVKAQHPERVVRSFTAQGSAVRAQHRLGFTALSAHAPAGRACAPFRPGGVRSRSVGEGRILSPGSFSPSGAVGTGFGAVPPGRSALTGRRPRCAGAAASWPRLLVGRRPRAAPALRGGSEVCFASGSPSDLAEVGPRPFRLSRSEPAGGEHAQEEAGADPAQPRSGWLRRQRDQLCRVSGARGRRGARWGAGRGRPSRDSNRGC